MSEVTINKIFEDKDIIKKIQERLPKLFQIANIEHSKGRNKDKSIEVGQSVGIAREQIIIAILICELGEENVNTDISSIQSEVDVIVGKNEISIKTMTNNKNFKLNWASDNDVAKKFYDEYAPKFDILFLHIRNKIKKPVVDIYLFTQKSQENIFEKITREKYLKMIKEGKNTRGVSIQPNAVNELIKHKDTKKIKIDWIVDNDLKYSPYERWIERWEDNK